MPRELNLAVELGAPDRLAAPARTALVGLAEQGALDFVTLGTSFAPDPLAEIARVAPLTRRIGLVPTAPSPPTPPDLAALDSVSDGRAGWLVSDAEEEREETVIRDGRRPPRGAPPLVVSLSAQAPDSTWELAARHADVVLLHATDTAAARTARTELLRRVRGAGRDPRELRLLLRVEVDLCNGSDLGDGYDLRPPPAPGTRFTGAATALAARLAQWRTETGADGFHLVPTTLRAELPQLVHGLVPRLREAGLFRAAYAGRTLREHLGLPGPVRPVTDRTAHLLKEPTAP
ncbi:LLM class flavin-dependent oxidoreductase [Streptomyces indicus]|uniref:Flavin-dependent oxidoreductase, luciferase family (Includes alkanesulfonate monooxygenase SsuD and methylene tetrahydromethanopterin reductase) n=1 Tax=Streptomyces indicus TaxID=417292 RepID=A0A1G8UC41_9ACTN|nr:LLM class flavin-dependent oxidoreductase [Streptomyces indicus]SDJ51327.1 Flavin-dependent oxidoreductase, luciferase family (includes alkanesulfonate monooxygenase SsuD and methylene tetrahydromethanopterin reductase) [Streptomyces indicus]